ncbi:MAG: AAA family ATPase [Alistipes sp.]|nr:AAA family ATPase [Alistipes sp.]
MKILNLSINHFRGIPNTCTLTFANKKNTPCSAIIYGGNGTGKSSIIDAIEYNLQGRIERSSALNNPQRPSVINFATPTKSYPSIKITFENGEEFERGISISKENIDIPTYNATPHNLPLDCFQNAPIVLRRSDIVLYNNTPKNERQIAINQFIYNCGYGTKDTPALISLKEKRVVNKRERDNIIKALSLRTKLSIESLKKFYEKDKGDKIETYIRQRFSPIGQKMAFMPNGIPKENIPEKKFAEIIKLATDLDKIKKKRNDLNRQISKLENDLKFEDNDITSSFYKSISKYLSSAFTKISNAIYIKEINVSIATDTRASFDIEITLKDGQKVSPHQIFSEANYDLIVLLLYLSIIRAGVEKGQSKVLIIDDVLQSVDASIRIKFINYILTELNDWQFIITCHDRLWLNQLRELFHRKSHTYKEFNISNWSFELGPTVIESRYPTFDETLKQAIETKNARIIASMSGLFLEKILHELSMSLRAKIERRPEDKYTINDLWGNVSKQLKTFSPILKSIVEEIDKFKHIRNLVGAHYNEWADMMSDDEILYFAQLLQQLYEKTFCSSCRTWVNRYEKEYCCNCRKLYY